MNNRICCEPGCTRKAAKKDTRCRRCLCSHYGLPYNNTELKEAKPDQYRHKCLRRRKWARLPETKERRRKRYANACELVKMRRKAARAVRKERSKVRLEELKKPGCLKCSEKDPTCLAFHHRSGENKLATISALRDGSPGRLAAEVAKCDLLCANCHAKIHAVTEPSPEPCRQEKKRLLEQRKAAGCSCCGEPDIRCLTMHHRADNKLSEVSNLLGRKLVIFLVELEKCDVLCFNCHMKLHFKAKTSEEASNETIRPAIEPSSA